jgi:hypothetical protein
MRSGVLLTLPCAGIIRTGSKGVLSPGHPLRANYGGQDP